MNLKKCNLQNIPGLKGDNPADITENDEESISIEKNNSVKVIIKKKKKKNKSEEKEEKVKPPKKEQNCCVRLVLHKKFNLFIESVFIF